MKAESITERNLRTAWTSSGAMIVLSVPMLILIGTAGDWLRLGTFGLVWATTRWFSKRNIHRAAWLHMIGAMGVSAWFGLASDSFSAHFGLGAIGYASVMMGSTLGMGVLFGVRGAVLGVLVGWTFLIPQMVVLSQWGFAAFLIASSGALGATIHGLFTQLETMQKALSRAATIDELTELGNRRALINAFDQYTALAAARGVALILTSWDLNDLKRINDSMGHAVGDAYIRRYARSLQASARLEDAFFRVGGDEFVGLHLDLEHGDHVIERVRAAFPSVSAGWSQTTNGLEVALIEADRRMYADKAQSKAANDLFERPLSDLTR